MLQDFFLCSNSIISIMYVRIISTWIWKKDIEQDLLNNQVSIYLDDASKIKISFLSRESIQTLILFPAFKDKNFKSENFFNILQPCVVYDQIYSVQFVAYRI